VSVFNVTHLWYELTKFANGYLHYAKHDKLMKLIYVLLIVLDPVPVTGNLVWQTRVPVAGTPESRDWSPGNRYWSDSSPSNRYWSDCSTGSQD